MALYSTGVQGFDLAARQAESARQTGMATATTQAAVRAVDLTYLQAIVAAGITNGVATLAESQALASIRSTGNP
jgi:hypothetical protein